VQNGTEGHPEQTVAGPCALSTYLPKEQEVHCELDEVLQVNGDVQLATSAHD
jgi:hypothetical protein